MFKFITRRSRQLTAAVSRVQVASMIEPLEDRQLLSGSQMFMPPIHGGFGNQLSSIQFSQAPSAVQTGLDKLAEGDGLADPTATQNVKLGNRDGIETYSVTFNSTGTTTTFTVDQNGSPVTAASSSSTTFGQLQSDDAAAANEINAIATALNLTAPATDSAVTVTTTLNGTLVYSINLSPSTSGTSAAPQTLMKTENRLFHTHSQLVSVDSAGNPVGNQNLPFSVIPSTIQDALNANAPSGATALASDSTQTVSVRTVNGVTTYSVTFTASGTESTVTVDVNGKLTSLPSHTTTTFGALGSDLQAAIQALATANKITTPIASDTNVDVLTEANGTVIYSVNLPTSSTSTGWFTRTLTISVDGNGNPTVLPGGDGRMFHGWGVNGFEPGNSAFGHSHKGQHGHGHGGSDSGDSGDNNSDGSTTGTTSPVDSTAGTTMVMTSTVSKGKSKSKKPKTPKPKKPKVKGKK